MEFLFYGSIAACILLGMLSGIFIPGWLTILIAVGVFAFYRIYLHEESYIPVGIVLIIAAVFLFLSSASLASFASWVLAML